MHGLEIVTTADRPDLHEQAGAAFRGLWPQFIFHDRLAAEYHPRSEEYFPQFDVLVTADGAVVAGGWGVPLRWDGTIADLPVGGYNGALIAAVSGYEAATTSDTLCVMAAAVRTDRQGAGLAGVVLTALRERAVAAGLTRVICPVRPASKADHPHLPMSAFAALTRPDGLHVDPWIRTHQRLGAAILAPAERSMVIEGTLADWETWTDRTFPASGRYEVAGALDLVAIDRERDHGTYIEPNLWMQHPA